MSRKMQNNYDNYESVTDYLDRVEGENVYRLLTGYIQYIVHSTKTGDVECLETEQCKLCQQKVKTANRWKWIAIDRRTHKVGLFKAPPTIGNTICVLAREKKFDPVNEDIIIYRINETPVRYNVYKAPESKPITDEEQVRISKDLERLIEKFMQ